MFNNISVIENTEHANAGAVMLFANRQLSNQELLKRDFTYTIKIFKTIWKKLHNFLYIIFIYMRAYKGKYTQCKESSLLV